MYYTVTVNPAVDYYMTVPDFSVSDINRSQFETLSFGGKGINVSKMMKALGMESTALGFIAGFTGTALKGMDLSDCDLSAITLSSSLFELRGATICLLQGESFLRALGINIKNL